MADPQNSDILAFLDWGDKQIIFCKDKNAIDHMDICYNGNPIIIKFSDWEDDEQFNKDLQVLISVFENQ